MPDEESNEPPRADETATAPAAADELTNPAYEFFIIACSVLSIVNFVLYNVLQNEEAKKVVGIVILLLSGILLVDFAVRLRAAPSKTAYVFRQGGILDFLGSLPVAGVVLFRLFRMARVGMTFYRLGARRTLELLRQGIAEGTLLFVVFLVILTLEIGSVLELVVETGPDVNITTASDALWWSYVTITTVGYGDYYPVGNPGRIVGIFVLTVGVALFATISGFLANAFLRPRTRKRTAPASPEAALAEIRSLISTQEATTTALGARLAELEEHLSAVGERTS